MPNEEEPAQGQDKPQTVSVEYTPEFKRNLRQLAKKYRRIKTDLQPILDALEQGQTPGDQISGVAYEVYKVRAQNSASNKGKSGGYRIIYQRTAKGAIVLVTLYSKTEQEDINPQQIRQTLLEHESQSVKANSDGSEASSETDSQ